MLDLGGIKLPLFWSHFVSPNDLITKCAEGYKWKRTGGLPLIKLVQFVLSNGRNPAVVPESWKMKWIKNQTNGLFMSMVGPKCHLDFCSLRRPS